MATVKRRSRRQKARLTPAEIQFLTGKEQAGANVYELMEHDCPSHVAQYEKLEKLISGYAHLIPKARASVLASHMKEFRRRYDQAKVRKLKM